MVIIGVTGGIGSGKSSVSAILGDLGAQVLDADAITRQVCEPHEAAWNQIVDTFGAEILNSDSTINRKKLAQIVFNDIAQKKKLEAIIHEKVLQEMSYQINNLKEHGYQGMVVLDVPIPVEDGFLNRVDEVWVVTASEEKRLKRIVARSGLSEEEARARMRAQLSQEDYIKLGHRIIPNEGSLEDLQETVEKLYHEAMRHLK